MSTQSTILNILEDTYQDQINNYKKNPDTYIKIEYEDLKTVFDNTITEKHLNLIKDTLHDKLGSQPDISIVNMPKSLDLQEISSNHIGQLISTKALINNISDINPGISTANYQCNECENRFTINQNDVTLKPEKYRCKKCNGTTTLNKENTVYKNYQTIDLEEPLEFRTNQQSRHILAILSGNIINPTKRFSPGEVVDITGILKTKTINKKDNFCLFINNIESNDKINEDHEPTEEDIIEIIKISKNQPLQRLSDSILPDIYWNDKLKQAVTILLFSGDNYFSQKDLKRNDTNVHILIVTPPGMAKSEVSLRIIEISPKGKYVNATETSLPGLLGTVTKDEFTGQWKLTGGAITLATNGICAIDEVDKCREEQLMVGLNEVMAQKTITISKAGVNTTMIANTRIFATGNPEYNNFTDKDRINYYDQLDIDSSALSRFDLIFALDDEKTDDEMRDMALKILNNEKIENTIPDDIIRKYIIYANRYHPQFTEQGQKIIAEYVVKLRNHRNKINHTKPITVRELRSLQKICSTIARIRLSNTISIKDIKQGIKLYTYSINSLGFDMDEQQFFNEMNI